MKMRIAFTAIISLAVCGHAFAGSHGTTSPMASPLGTNLSVVSNSTPEQPFLDIFKTGSVWLTETNCTAQNAGTNEQAKLSVDANGWPTSLSPVGGGTFTCVSAQLFDSLVTPFYPSGQYAVLYTGAPAGGSLTYYGDATGTYGGAGRDILTVSSPSAAGIWIGINGTITSGSHFTNIHLIYCGATCPANPCVAGSTCSTNENLFSQGERFNPVFIAKMKPFRNFRFVDWERSFGDTQMVAQYAAWSARPVETQAFWGVTAVDSPACYNAGFCFGIGVPLETDIALSNETGADAWFSIPSLADSTYFTQSATLVHSTLHSNARVYIEIGDEMWGQGDVNNKTTGDTNNSYYILGKATWPTCDTAPANTSSCTFSYYTKQLSALADAWASVWGADFNRVIPLVNTVVQFGNAALLGTPGSNSSFVYSGTPIPGTQLSPNVKGYAAAPYFPAGMSPPQAWTGLPDHGLANVFTELMFGGLIPSVNILQVPTFTPNQLGGLPNAYTLTSDAHWGNGVIPATPINGTLIQFTVPSGATACGGSPCINTGSSTLKVDGGTVYPLQFGAAGTNALASQISSGPTLYAAAFTNLTSSGSVTPAWVIVGSGNSVLPSYPTGGIQRAIDQYQININDNVSNGYGLTMLAYEGGAGFGLDTDPIEVTNLFLAATRDPRMATVVATYYQKYSALTGATLMNQYLDVSPYSAGLMFGMLENITQASSPKYAGAIDFIRRTPCWWSGCRH